MVQTGEPSPFRTVDGRTKPGIPGSRSVTSTTMLRVTLLDDLWTGSFRKP
jgi:hypothetical protein